MSESGWTEARLREHRSLQALRAFGALIKLEPLLRCGFAHYKSVKPYKVIGVLNEINSR